MQFILSSLLLIGFLASSGLMPAEAPACRVDVTEPYLVAEDDRPLDGRVPLILVHGWIAECHGGKQGWEKLIRRIESEGGADQFKIYRFVYSSRRLGLEDAGSALSEAIAARRELEGEKLLFIGHSVGGLVARTFIQLQGGGERVIKLITLATPHHGSPLASLVALAEEGLRSDSGRDDLKRVLHLSPYSDPLLAGAKLLLSLSYRLIYGIYPSGFLDIRWDDYDSLSHREYARYSEQMKKALDNRLLRRLNSDTRFDHQIIAYYGCLSHPLFHSRWGGDLPTFFYGLSGEVERMLPGSFEWNDGLIPIQSASFAGHDVKRRACPSMTHTDMRDHPQVQGRLLQDLKEIASELERKRRSVQQPLAQQSCRSGLTPGRPLRLCAELN